MQRNRVHSVFPSTLVMEALVLLIFVNRSSSLIGFGVFLRVQSVLKQLGADRREAVQGVVKQHQAGGCQASYEP